ncbi:hypothetical protein ACFWIJ_18945 [Streptomyces sp. NPDC127079]|uniref:hypothetical protein n=1 Tax=Streptomyces sp. NPDC127079 TaxID=3347132 RepID=UPI00366188D9
MSDNPQPPQPPRPAVPATEPTQPAAVPATEPTQPAAVPAGPADLTPVSAGPADVPPPGGKVRDRRRTATLAGVGVVVAAVLAGTAYTVVTVRDADRDPGAPVWSLPKAPRGTKPAAGSGLRGMLLPYGDSYERGPDMTRFGSDAALSGREADLLRAESIKDLPRSQQRAMQRQFDRTPVKGMAMRSYVNTEVPYANTYTMRIVLAQLGSRGTARSLAQRQSGYLGALKVLRKGPVIKGYENSTACFLVASGSKETLDLMFCSGSVGDVLVTATATAAKPLNKGSVADMLRAQLDRIKDPGASV